MIRYGGLRDWIPGISQWFVMLINPATLTASLFIIAAEVVRQFFFENGFDTFHNYASWKYFM